MLDNSMLRPGHGTTRNVVMADWHDAHVPLVHTRPWLLAFSTEGSCTDMGLLLGERRIDEAAMAKAEAFLEKEPARFSCDMRLVPVGGAGPC